jgi:hypothetical protein
LSTRSKKLWVSETSGGADAAGEGGAHRKGSAHADARREGGASELAERGGEVRRVGGRGYRGHGHLSVA